MSSLPLISAKCITYGRTHFLEESLHSFLNQDYPGQKEMIIVNDYPLQTLVFDHPEVKIINVQETFPTIGDKENFALEHCNGELIAVWDDDDVAMPNHMSNIYKYFAQDANLLQWSRGVLFNGDNVEAITGLGNSGIVYTKKIWKELGGHPLENAGYDMTFVQSIHRKGGVVNAAPPDDEVSWFYMWGGRGYHMSGLGTDDDKRPNAIQRHSAYVEAQRSRGQIPTGVVNLVPKWNRNYSEILKNFIDARNTSNSTNS
jgi:glycosyltransferase involved in cell wall biosynthesis